MTFYVRYIFIIDVYVFDYFNVHLYNLYIFPRQILYLGMRTSCRERLHRIIITVQFPNKLYQLTVSHSNPQLFPQQPPSKSPVACQTRWENKSRNVPSVRTASNQTRDNMSEDVSDLTVWFSGWVCVFIRFAVSLRRLSAQLTHSEQWAQPTNSSSS